MYSYILIDKIQYEGTWIIGVVYSLEEATVYFDNNIKYYKEPQKMSDEELIHHALIDNWEVDYCDHYVEVYDSCKQISTFKFNVKTRILEEQHKPLD